MIYWNLAIHLAKIPKKTFFSLSQYFTGFQYLTALLQFWRNQEETAAKNFEEEKAAEQVGRSLRAAKKIGCSDSFLKSRWNCSLKGPNRNSQLDLNFNNQSDWPTLLYPASFYCSTPLSQHSLQTLDKITMLLEDHVKNVFHLVCKSKRNLSPCRFLHDKLRFWLLSLQNNNTSPSAWAAARVTQPHFNVMR